MVLARLLVRLLSEIYCNTRSLFECSARSLIMTTPRRRSCRSLVHWRCLSSLGGSWKKPGKAQRCDGTSSRHRKRAILCAWPRLSATYDCWLYSKETYFGLNRCKSGCVESLRGLSKLPHVRCHRLCPSWIQDTSTKCPEVCLLLVTSGLITLPLRLL